jgi:hypothetical protein
MIHDPPSPCRRPSTWANRGQTLAEVALALPLLIIMVVATFEVGFLLYQDHVVKKLAREGANLLSRAVSMADIETVIEGAHPYPGGNFVDNGKLILSVVRLGTSGTNEDEPIITQRHVIGDAAGDSALGNVPAGSYTGAPNYNAVDPADDTSIRPSALPNGLTVSAGQSVFVAEIYTNRKDIASLAPFGITPPSTFYAITFF